MEGARSSLLKMKFDWDRPMTGARGAEHLPRIDAGQWGTRVIARGETMTSFDQRLAVGASANQGMGLRWSPPPMPVLLRVPRIVEEPTYLPAIPLPAAPSHRVEFRWRVGIGVGVLMLLAAIPWLVRWHPQLDRPLEASPPALAMETDSDIEILPVLDVGNSYAHTGSNRSAFVHNLGSENSSELVEDLTVPHPAGVRQ